MKQHILLVLPLIFYACAQPASLEGFQPDRWREFTKECTDYRLNIAGHIIKHQEALLESNQNEIEALLGAPTEHELYKRNQKFFHYQLTPSDSCGSYASQKFISIRFNAIGLANEVQLVIRE